MIMEIDKKVVVEILKDVLTRVDNLRESVEKLQNNMEQEKPGPAKSRRFFKHVRTKCNSSGNIHSNLGITFGFEVGANEVLVACSICSGDNFNKRFGKKCTEDRLDDLELILSFPVSDLGTVDIDHLMSRMIDIFGRYNKELGRYEWLPGSGPSDLHSYKLLENECKIRLRNSRK